jgi:hypothetical protein
LVATPAQANTLTLICTGKTFTQNGGEIDMVPGTAVLDLDKLTFKPPWSSVVNSIHTVEESEIGFSVVNSMISSSGTLDRVTGRLDYSTTWREGSDRWSSVGVCKPAKPLF